MQREFPFSSSLRPLHRRSDRAAPRAPRLAGRARQAAAVRRPAAAHHRKPSCCLDSANRVSDHSINNRAIDRLASVSSYRGRRKAERTGDSQ
ncbi:hypothetical protein C7S14_5982 [Burkholderia cepacia]|nr:hypothetical protein C7S14_5982 [Burkholderia cepacia]